MQFETVVPIAHGGMGEVFRAWDPRLERFVALKFLRSDDPLLLERLDREARAQARLDHPHVAKVYEVGDHDGRPYIAMQFIDGLPLSTAAATMTLEGKVEIVRTVAEAVHHAHTLGLVHRDLKPTNILVERLESGEVKPWVIDFGLVREDELGSLTLTGDLIGTPSYMAPEQARGDRHRVDRRTDVYALGAVLYELLAGRPPFVADSAAQVLVQVLEREPQPPRQLEASVPADLEAIALTCLEKEPQHRYGSARELAEDLGRWLAGEPVLAQRTSLARRVLRRARRRPLVAATVAIAAVAVLAAAAVVVETRWTAATRSRTAREFGERAERLSGRLRMAALAPSHDVRPVRREVRDEIATIAQDGARLGSAAAGAADSAVGRVLLALGEPDEARKHLERAWAAGNHDPTVAEALGHALMRLYQAELREITVVRDEGLREHRRHEAERLLREPAAEVLRHATESAPQGFLDALLAFSDGRLEEASRATERALEAEPWRWEAAVLAGDVAVAKLDRARRADDAIAVRNALASADGWYRRASEIGRSEPAAHAARCGLAALAMELALHDGGEDAETWYEEAQTSCSEALELDADYLDALLKLASVDIFMGRQRAGAGEDPLPVYGEALTAAERVVTLAPDNGPAQRAHGDALLYFAEHRRRLGENADDQLAAALDAYRLAVELEPGYVKGYNGLGLAAIDRAEVEAARGLDPTATIAAGVAALERGVELFPAYTHAHNNLGILHRVEAEHQLRTGRDPRPALVAAAAAYARAMDSNPRYSYAANNLGNVHMMEVEYLIGHGLDPSNAITAALDAYYQATERNPSWAYPAVNRGIVLRLQAQWLAVSGDDPMPSLAAAIESLEQGLAMLGPHPAPLAELARCHLDRARAALDHDTSPLPALADARRAVHQLLVRDPADAQASELAGRAWLFEARWRRRHGGGVARCLSAARQALEAAVTANPMAAESFHALAEVALEQAELEASPEVVARGLAAARRAVEINPELATAWLTVARLALSTAGAIGDADLRLEAAAALDRAAAINPRLAADAARLRSVAGVG
jgi:tetratricopeptide (TPR) repeat protein/predicted Ser/Thr protein kinase